MSNLPRPDGTRGRWARRLAALAFGVGLGLGTATHVPDASADAQHRPPAHAAHATHATHAKAARHAPHAPVAAAHGRAEPVATHRRARLALPPTEHVAIGAGLTGADQTPSAAATEAAAAIDKLLRGPLRQGTTGIYVVDADTGRELFSLRPDERLNPASNVKMISTATALDLLGPDYRYRTRLLGPGADAEGTVAGDVYLHGSYDPTLGADGLEDLAARVAAGGVKRITGDVLVGSVPTRDGLYRSRIGIDVTAGAPGAAPRVEISPADDFVEVKNEATTGRRARVKGSVAVTSELVTRPDGHAHLVVTVRGTIGKGKHVARAIVTKERALNAAYLLRAALRRHGVELDGDVAVRELPAYVNALAGGGHLPVALGEHKSAALADIITQVNKRSINWLSDRVVATAAMNGSDEAPTVEDGVEAMYAWLDHRAGIHRSDAVVDTGSGLSYRTQLSTRQLVSVLRAATGLAHGSGAPADGRAAACAKAFTHSLSIAGVDGTLRARFHDALRGRVIAKTGTLSDVIALSGVLTGPAGHRIVFSLVTNGHDRSRKRTIRAGHEQVLAILDHYLAMTAPKKAAAESAEPVVAARDAAPAPATSPEAAAVAEPAPAAEPDEAPDAAFDGAPAAASDSDGDDDSPADSPDDVDP